MLDITRIDHISMAVSDAEAQVQFLEGLLGFEATGTWTEQTDGYRGVNLRVPGRSDINWEVLEPLRPDSFVQRFLDSPMGPGLHHVTFEVPDVDATVEQLRDVNIEPWGDPPPVGEHWREVFIHPRDGHGFLFQFAGRHDHDADDDEPAARAPHEPGRPALGITAINHLSHSHPDRTALAFWYERVFGMQGIFASDASGGPFSTAVLETPTQQMRWEVLQPSGPGSFVQRFLDERGPTMHHVTFEVGDWRQAVDACGDHDVPMFGEREGVTDGARWREAFIHPRHTGGLLIQFFWEERPGVWI
ncbi:MAG: VOC family protein [Dehalococcoidia bacterium]